MGGGHDAHEIRQRGGMEPGRVSRRAGRGEQRDGVSLPRGCGEDEEGAEMPDRRGGAGALKISPFPLPSPGKSAKGGR